MAPGNPGFNFFNHVITIFEGADTLGHLGHFVTFQGTDSPWGPKQWLWPLTRQVWAPLAQPDLAFKLKRSKMKDLKTRIWVCEIGQTPKSHIFAWGKE